ncbi:MAG: hypothetical protein ACRDYC_09390 [Acidimicrobiales bacterium]
MTQAEAGHTKDVAEDFDRIEHLLNEASEVHRLPKREPKSSLAVRFDSAELERLCKRADADGVAITQLVRGWVLDRLDEPTDAAMSELLVSLEIGTATAEGIEFIVHAMPAREKFMR